MKSIRIVFLTLITLCFIVAIPCVGVLCYAEGESVKYIDNVADFKDAIFRGRPMIYVDDLSFDKDTTLQINGNMQIIGKKNRSTIERAHFTVKGPNGAGEKVDVVFKNIVLDGMVSRSDYDFETPGQSFTDVFDTSRSDKGCIQGLEGYFAINLENCDIRGYATYNGPAVYVNNLENYREASSERSVNMNACEIYDNICYNGTVMIAGDIGNNTIKD